ncbi:MAG: LysE family translocator [Bacteroidales bacterium]|jgi:threonine/homoserine/homoserine lactone efflux protein|nr:LysE family translocator [Bacteroidales bacterium]MCI1785491.1 LysE family translocator [Bacteroidales bacterium]
MIVNEILKGFVIGICASAPIGPIAIFVIQQSLSYGHKTGFVTGLGATFVDTLFAIIAIFALAVAQEFVSMHRELILIVGGIVVALLGCSMAFRDPFRRMKADGVGSSISIKDFLQAIILGLSNPGAIFVIFALFAFFNVDVMPHNLSVAPILLAVAAGSAVYWFFFSWLFSRWSKTFRVRQLLWINRIAGIIVMILGVVLLCDGVFKGIFTIR